MIMQPFTLGTLALAVMLLAAIMTGVVRGYARKRLLDHPNARSSHSLPTPRGGGLAIVAAFTLAILFLYRRGDVSPALAMALAGALPVAAIGFLDDHRHVPVRWRLLVQVSAAFWAVFWLGGGESIQVGGAVYPLGWFGFLASGFFIVWMLNLFNFMDGIDGIAGIEVVSVAMSALILLSSGMPAPDPAGLGGVLAALAAATGGFLVWNWPPAKIFMGDVGSGFVGFLVAVLALKTASGGGLSPVVWLILVGVFFVDAGLTLLRRVLTGQRWYEAHRSHAYQHAALRWGSHERVTLAVLFINLGGLLPLALCAARWPRWEPAFLALAYGLLAMLAWRFDAGKA
jgi:Fuc2NAc and GlcNAc transferase